jgi:hypothetical protein
VGGVVSNIGRGTGNLVSETTGGLGDGVSKLSKGDVLGGLGTTVGGVGKGVYGLGSGLFGAGKGDDK